LPRGVLHVAGGHEIVDVALRGSSADYLLGESGWTLEIAGRSRRNDFSTAWEQKMQRLLKNSSGGFFVFVAEFESPRGRLEYVETH
jgi:hypothetical protein